MEQRAKEQGKLMRKKIFNLTLHLSALCLAPCSLLPALFALLFALAFPTEGQQVKNIPRIGYLSSLSPSSEIADLASTSRRAAIYPQSEYVEAGGLMSYGVSEADLDRRTATYVDKILKGAKPADLPVEQPTKFELVINLKTAKQIGLTIPPAVLARADRVIK